MASHNTTATPRTPGRAVRVAVLCLVLMAIAYPAMADLWYEHYARAEQALANEDWNLAVRELNEALARKADSGSRVRSYGMKVISYFPYLKLGIAYQELGQYNAALQAFDTEERIGAVQQSEPDLSELERYRKRALGARDSELRAQQERISKLVEQNIAEAEDLERRGLLEDAMAALGRALAVEPGDPALERGMERLREKVAAKQRQKEEETRRSRLLAEGRSLLDRAVFDEASSRFRQALAIRDDSDTRKLLDRAETGLRKSIQAEQDETRRRSKVTGNLELARHLADTGDVSGALDALQLVLTVDPENAEAASLHDRLVQRSREEEDLTLVSESLAEAQREFVAGRFEASLAAANRALAFDSGNVTAVEYIQSAYREINSRLLGSRSDRNIPPAIRFADFRTDHDGTRAQIVQKPEFTLSGVAIDDAPVVISCIDQSGVEIPVQLASQGIGEYTITEFRIERRLPRGTSMLRLVATDPGGQSSRSEYEVIFEQPFYDTPWFRLSGAAVPFIAIGGFVFARVRRRRKLLKRRFNPYIAGAPVLDQDLFFGRSALIDRILQTIHNNSLLLHGERRIGKTSLQHQLKKRLRALDDPRYEFFPVYIDLQGTPEDRFFSTLAADIFDELGPALGELRPLRDFSENGHYGYRDFVADLRRILETLSRRSSRQVKLVLLIDEVDELNSYDPRINQKLRSLFMRNFAENLVSVVSGVQIKKDWNREGSPWYNFFEEIEVRPFRREDAVDLVTRPIRGIFALEQGVADRIIELTGSRPYLIQKYCAALINRLHEENRRTIRLADVEALSIPEDA